MGGSLEKVYGGCQKVIFIFLSLIMVYLFFVALAVRGVFGSLLRVYF